ncbi:MAG TPA: formate dehydrogenase subunit gamma [Alphaproteobacteria bacterium]|nr:formate dehydrogenase subunit gamma [Alphaproteobacteria bacterium]
MSTNLAAWDEVLANEVISQEISRPGALLPVLHALQSTFGFISERAAALVADRLNLSRAEVHGVLSFYHDFRREPPGAHSLKLCRAEACQSMGGDALAAQAQGQLGIGWGETSNDGKVTLEPVFCLGLCACAPSAMLDGRPIGRLDVKRLEALIQEACA